MTLCLVFYFILPTNLKLRLQPDSTDILSYTLGLLSLVIACTSRFPVICQAVSDNQHAFLSVEDCMNSPPGSFSHILLLLLQYRGHKWTRGRVISWLLCALAGALYATAILLYDTGSGFVLRVLPWLMSAVCGAVLDLLVSLHVMLPVALDGMNERMNACCCLVRP